MTAEEPGAWPAGHRAALVLAFAVDGEYGVIDAHGADAWSWRAQARYDLETGIWRVLELLRDYDVPATFCWVGRAAEERPDAVRAAHADGHEIACHGWDHRGYAGRSLAEQRDDLRRTREALARISGAEPQGHLTPGRRFDEETPRALQDLGFRWSLDLMSGDLPSLARPDPARDPVVQIPPTRLADDVSFFVRAAAPPRPALEY
ncbi:MAG: polysaccharide deacetylase family protein, partial [Thermomicrobiaceae bacterium]|nr:polysaccharide deacetylase family protein [Thermomicrobiaceae bacterium]